MTESRTPSRSFQYLAENSVVGRISLGLVPGGVPALYHSKVPSSEQFQDSDLGEFMQAWFCIVSRSHRLEDVWKWKSTLKGSQRHGELQGRIVLP